MNELWVVRAGALPYEEARSAQRALAERRRAGELPDLLLCLEHPPVYTKGRRSSSDELPMGEDWYRMQGIEVVETDRGGRVTYHGPGQLVAYPIIDLHELDGETGIGVDEFVRRMEQAMIASLADWGIAAAPFEGLTGVWVGERPPPAGLAINVNNDLQPFEWIVPCGIEACSMTSVSRELGGEQDLGAFATTVAQRLAEGYCRAPVERSWDEVVGSLALGAA
jgi:lipoyl(octanoyl) transferase